MESSKRQHKGLYADLISSFTYYNGVEPDSFEEEFYDNLIHDAIAGSRVIKHAQCLVMIADNSVFYADWQGSVADQVTFIAMLCQKYPELTITPLGVYMFELRSFLNPNSLSKYIRSTSATIKIASGKYDFDNLIDYVSG
jgi:hypothetical protein